MAGTIIADFIRADANKFSINVGNTIIASVNSLGILSNTGNVMISSAGVLEANSVYYNGSAVLSSGKVQRVNQPTGSVLQVVQAFKSDVSSFAGTVATWTDISGLSATITPTSSSSKILCMCFLGKVSTSGTTWYTHSFRFTRGGSAIGVADAAGSRPQAGMTTTDYDGNYSTGGNGMHYLDSPASTSTQTYTVQILPHSTGSITTYINRGESDTDGFAGIYGRGSSNLILMEIAG